MNNALIKEKEKSHSLHLFSLECAYHNLASQGMSGQVLPSGDKMKIVVVLDIETVEAAKKAILTEISKLKDVSND